MFKEMKEGKKEKWVELSWIIWHKFEKSNKLYCNINIQNLYCYLWFAMPYFFCLLKYENETTFSIRKFKVKEKKA